MNDRWQRWVRNLSINYAILYYTYAYIYKYPMISKTKPISFIDPIGSNKPFEQQHCLNAERQDTAVAVVADPGLPTTFAPGFPGATASIPFEMCWSKQFRLSFLSATPPTTSAHYVLLVMRTLFSSLYTSDRPKHYSSYSLFCIRCLPLFPSPSLPLLLPSLIHLPHH